MAIAKVKKIEIIAHVSLLDKLLERLRKYEVVEINHIQKKELSDVCSFFEETAGDSKETEKKVKYILQFLKNFISPDELKRKIEKGKLVLRREEILEILKKVNISELEKECIDLENKLRELQDRKNALEGTEKQVFYLKDITIPLSELSDTNYTASVIGKIANKKYPVLLKELSKKDSIFFKVIGEEKKIKKLLVIFLKSDKIRIKELLQKHDFNQITVPFLPLAPKEFIAQTKKQLEEIEINKQQVEEKIKAIAEDFIDVIVLSDYYENIKEKEDIKKYFLKTKSSFYFSGWILADKVKKVRDGLNKIFPEIEMLFTEPKADEDIPVALENKKAIKPFEVITDLYGRPHYFDIDPTPVLAVFFAIFFGLCITDAGYGIIICLVTAYILLFYKKKKLDAQVRKFIALFLLGGIFTVLMGMMAGGWFGITVKWQLFDPLKDLKIFFALAIGLGICQVITGLLIKVYKDIANKDWEAAVFGPGLWILLLLSSVGFGIASMAFSSQTAGVLFKQGMLIASLGIVFFQGREADKNDKSDMAYMACWIVFTLALSFLLGGILTSFAGLILLLSLGGIFFISRKNLLSIFYRVGLGIYAFYGVAGYFGDILSYSRLVALGLGTGIVAMVINKIAQVASQAPIYISIILVPVILLVGHTFNLAINILSAFVHSCRLQYVEFFTKFYESGGKYFKPFKEEYKYITIKEKQEV